jgi:glycerophosphoryl diester phosphodiesterase
MKINTKILTFAHAGGKKNLPENTLKAFKNAIKLNADYIELDLRLSKDQEIIIFHDPDTFNITSIPGLVKNKTLKELKRLDVGEGERIPTFQEVVELANHKIGLLLHIAAADLEAQIIKILREFDYIELTIVSCMIHKYLLKFRVLEPNLKLAALEDLDYEEYPIWDVRKKLIDRAINNKYWAINPEYHLVDRQFVDYSHKNDLRVFPWTVNDREDIKTLLELGIDGVITDDITLIKELIIS